MALSHPYAILTCHVCDEVVDGSQAGGLLVFVRNVAPRLLGANMQQEAKALEAEYRKGNTSLSEGQVLAYRPMTIRASRVEQAAEGSTITQIDKDQTTMIAAGVHPPHQYNALSNVLFAEGATELSSF